MEFSLTEDQERIRAAASEFLRTRYPRGMSRARDAHEPGEVRAMWKDLVRQGWVGLAVPERHGGAGAGFVETCLLLEELGAYQVATPLLVTAACAGRAVDRFGTAEQRDRWLPAIADGQIVSYVRTGERPGWGSRDSGLRAEPDGPDVVLNGTSWFVPHAHVADAFLVVARTGPHDRPTVFLVAAGTPGIEHRPLDTVHPEPVFRSRFVDVRVAGSAVLGPPGAGERVVDFIDDHGAAATCVNMAGGAQRVLEMSVDYAQLRHQFGRPLGAFQAIQHLCADMAVDVLGARLIAYEAVCGLAEQNADATTVASAKAWVGEAYQRVCAGGHQVHGAIGYTDEHDMHRFLRHALASASSFGDADVHVERVTRALGLS